MSTVTIARTEAEIRVITDEDAERYVARSNFPEEVKAIQLHYRKEIFFLEYLSNTIGLSDSEVARIEGEIRELHMVMEDKMEEAIERLQEKESEAPTVSTTAEATREAAKAAYAQGITEVQKKTSTDSQGWRQAWETRDEGTTPSGVRIMNKVERDELRKTPAFKNRNALWNARIPGLRYTFGSPKRLGNMAEMVARLRPNSLPEFIEHYTTRVNSWEVIDRQADEFYRFIKKSGFAITPEEALAEHIIHTLDQTWEGWEREEQSAVQLSAALGVEIGRPEDVMWDVDFGIDLVKVDPTEKRDGFTEGYQVKPAAFFTSDNQGVKWARAQNVAKHRKAEALEKRVWFVNGDALARGEVKLIHWSKISDA